MPPRRRRWWTRPELAAATAHGPGGPATLGPPAVPVPAGPATDRLRELAEQGATGALELTGSTTGSIYLVAGQISHMHAASCPGPDLRTRTRGALPAERLPPLRLHALLRDALADAALALLGDRDASHAETRFSDGQQHWSVLRSPRGLPEVLAEVARRRRVLVAIDHLAGPDRPPSRSTRPAGDQIRLSSAQWDLVRLADGGVTPRALAWSLGRGVFEVTVEIATLCRAGLLETPAPGTRTHEFTHEDAVPPFLSAFLPATR